MFSLRHQSLLRGIVPPPTIHSIKMGNLKVLLDSGADANFAPEKIKLYFLDSIVEPLHPPVHANMANQTRQHITHTATICLPSPFNFSLKFYLLAGLQKLIIGKPTLRLLSYTIDKAGEYLTINNKRTNITNLHQPIQIHLSNVDTTAHTIIHYLTTKYPQLVSETARPPSERSYKYSISLDTDQIIQSKPYFLTHQEKLIVDKFIDENLKSGIIERVPHNDSIHLSPTFIVHQLNKQQRVVVDNNLRIMFFCLIGTDKLNLVLYY